MFIGMLCSYLFEDLEAVADAPRVELLPGRADGVGHEAPDLRHQLLLMVSFFSNVQALLKNIPDPGASNLCMHIFPETK